MSIVDDSIIDQCREEVLAASTQHELDQVKSKYLGGKSAIRQSLKSLGALDPKERARVSTQINAIKKQLSVI